MGSDDQTMTTLRRLIVELESGTEPIRGRIDDRGSWVSFAGWLELIGALERVHRGEPADGQPAKDFGAIHDAGTAVPVDTRRREGVGVIINTGGDALPYARIARFTDATPQQIASTVSAIEAADGPPPGVPSTGITVVVDKQEQSAVIIGFFATEEDLVAGDAALREMDPPGGAPGTLASVDMGEIRVQRQVSDADVVHRSG
jgi:hypothetical protein